jgi:hypothetical protein
MYKKSSNKTKTSKKIKYKLNKLLKTKRYNTTYKYIKKYKLKGGTLNFFIARIVNPYFGDLNKHKYNNFYELMCYYYNNKPNNKNLTYTLKRQTESEMVKTLYEYFFDKIKYIILVTCDSINGNRLNENKKQNYKKLFEQYQNSNIFYDLYKIIEVDIKLFTNMQTTSPNNNTNFEYLEIIETIKKIFSVNDDNNIKNNEYKNWADIKKYNSYLLDSSIKLPDDYSYDLFLPYHLFRKFYVDLLLLIATVVSAKIFMNINKFNSLNLILTYNNQNNREPIKLGHDKPVIELEVMFNSVGSVNLDSDYDITINYKITPLVSSDNFKYKQYAIHSSIYMYFILYIQTIFKTESDEGRISDEVFDTNIYTDSYLISNKTIINDYNNNNNQIIIKLVNNEYIFNISYYDLFILELKYIIIKLIELNINKFNILNASIKNFYTQLCNGQSNTTLNSQIQTCNSKVSGDSQIKEHIKIASRRSSFNNKTTLANIDKPNNHINDKINTLLNYYELTLKERFYSFESYYSLATIIHVVGILQSKYITLASLPVEFIKCMSFLSIIENYVDLLKYYYKYNKNNEHNTTTDNTNIYYKISKYIARIYHAFYLFINYDSDTLKQSDSYIYSFGGYDYIMLLKTFNLDIANKFNSGTNKEFFNANYSNLNILFTKIVIDNDNNTATIKEYGIDEFINLLTDIIINLNIDITTKTIVNHNINNISRVNNITTNQQVNNSKSSKLNVKLNKYIQLTTN